MCGRFNILTDVEALVATFEILHDHCLLDEFEPRFNISPSLKNTPISTEFAKSLTTIPIVRLNMDNQKILHSAVWPLVPSWAGEQVPKYSTANARSETMTEKASFRNAWKLSQRCLIPATGFYEWQKVQDQKNKQPWHIRHNESNVMSFAGIWEKGRTSEDEPFISCSIITTRANQLMSQIHNSNHRMPVIIDPENRDLWLGRDNDSAFSLTATYGDGRLIAHPISTKINNPKYSVPDCIDAIEPST